MRNPKVPVDEAQAESLIHAPIDVCVQPHLQLVMYDVSEHP